MQRDDAAQVLRARACPGFSWSEAVTVSDLGEGVEGGVVLLPLTLKQPEQQVGPVIRIIEWIIIIMFDTWFPCDPFEYFGVPVICMQYAPDTLFLCN